MNDTEMLRLSNVIALMRLATFEADDTLKSSIDNLERVSFYHRARELVENIVTSGSLDSPYRFSTHLLQVELDE